MSDCINRLKWISFAGLYAQYDLALSAESPGLTMSLCHFKSLDHPDHHFR